jgi:hypothetical protein
LPMLSKQRAEASAKEFIKQKYNSVKTVQALYPSGKYSIDAQKATRMLKSPAFNQALRKEFENAGMTEEFIASILYRNTSQSKNISGSNQAIEIWGRFTGSFAPDKHISTSLNIDINDNEAIEQRLKEIKKELSDLSHG